MSVRQQTLVAIDVDGVLNVLKRPQRGLVERNIGGWDIAWRPSTIKALRDFLKQPEVKGVWLSRWLEWPEKLEELERELKLEGLIERAEHPKTAPAEFGWRRIIRDFRFPRVSTLEPRSGYWWKFRSAELLIEQHPEHRFVWLDDELGYSNHGSQWAPMVNENRILYKVNPHKGLMPLDIRKLDAWHNGGDL